MRILYVLLLVIIYIHCSAQERVDRTSTLTFSRKSDKITTAVGWKYELIQGKWISNNKVIDDKYCNDYWKSHIIQNFNEIYCATFTYQNKQYVAFIIVRDYGRYYYPNIREDWNVFEETMAFIIETKKYSNLIDSLQNFNGRPISLKADFLVSIKSEDLGRGIDYDEKFLLSSIEQKLRNLHTSEICFQISSQIIKDEKLVRFLLPEKCYSKTDISKAYFEISFKQWENLSVL